ncbi:MAG: rRNA maturation RNase YbeY [Alphaproteobacteria bacterium]|nr:rRNA maturation RNase YbeY [Alphaproteobacteria bacterium]
MIRISIARQSPLWPAYGPLIRRAVKSAHRLAKGPAGEVSILLADDTFIKDLNKTWRGKNKATNVLSFPQDTPGILGDIVLAQETIAREAKAQRKSFAAHLTHLVIHGYLHLIGYDHENKADARKMEDLEIKILTSLKIKNPYI